VVVGGEEWSGARVDQASARVDEASARVRVRVRVRCSLGSVPGVRL